MIETSLVGPNTQPDNGNCEKRPVAECVMHKLDTYADLRNMLAVSVKRLQVLATH